MRKARSLTPEQRAEAERLREELQDVRLQEYIRRVVAGMPPLTDGQIDRLRGLLFSEKALESSASKSSRLSKVDPSRAPLLGPQRPQPTALYRHRDANGVLLYVGITDQPDVRSQTHLRGPVWGEFVDPTQSTTCWYAARELALAAEREAIESEHPLFNRQHSQVDPRAPARYLAERGKFEMLVVRS